MTASAVSDATFSEVISVNPDEPAHCQPGALTDSYGLLVQLILAILAFCSLIVKRALEPPWERRPWTIWFFDTSKQAAGAGVIHLINVFLSDMFQGDPCTWYVVSFLLDSTLGLLIIYVCVRLVSCMARCKHWPTLKFGEYGSPPQCRPWFHQCLVFLAITVFEKIVITVVIQLRFWVKVRRLILSPIHSPRVEVALVMLVIPFVVNTLMFWVVDNFTKRRSTSNGCSGVHQNGVKAGDDQKNVPYATRLKGGMSRDELQSLERLLEADNSDSEGAFVHSTVGAGFMDSGKAAECLVQRHGSTGS